jgi:uncharacterized protein YihD (DUF1040 family)
MNLKQYFIDYLEHSSAIIELAWLTGSIFILFIFILIVYLKYLRSHLRNNERTRETYRKKYELKLLSYLYSGSEEQEISPEQQIIVNELKKDLANPFKRSIVVSTLLKLKNEISGELDESIQKLYFQTGLIDFSLSKLTSRKWHVVAKGVRELTQFHIKEVHDEVAVLINHPKNEVRKEMQLYLVNLFSFKGLDFLNVLKTQLSEWDQIQLLDVLQRFDEEQNFDIKPWLKSSNDSVVIFALKLADIYIQFEAKEQLIELLSHKSEKIRIELISVLGNLNITEAKSVLKSNFTERSQEEQLAFFKMIENMPETSDEPFLLEYIRHENFEIKYSALKTLKIINLNKYTILKNTASEPDFIRIVEFLEHN